MLISVFTGFILPPKTYAAGNLSDQTFFGVWSGTAWTTVGKLNYAYNGGVLSAVEADVKAANYTQAKADLRTYYQNRTSLTVPVMPVNSTSDKGKANLALRNTFTGPATDYLVDTMTFTNTFSTVTKDILEQAKDAVGFSNNLSFMLMGAYKETSIAEIYSRETGTVSQRPTITFVIDGTSYDVIANKDTYITGSSSTTNGTATSLLVRDSGAPTVPFDSSTYRTYINFDVSSLPQTGMIQSATLKLYGRNQSAGSKDLNLLYLGDTTWSESTLNWNGITTGNIYSYDAVTGGPTWNSVTGADPEYVNVINRFDFATTMINEHLLNPTETVYTSKLVYLMMDFLTDKSAGYNRPLETGDRLGAWTYSYNYLKNTTVLNDSDNTEILKFIWQDANYLSNPANWTSTSNWGIIETTGFFKAATYFPEFTAASSWLSTANSRLAYMINREVLNDSAFAESTSGYATYMVSLFLDCKKFASVNNQSVASAVDRILQQLAKFSMDSTYPNGYDPNYGDSNYEDDKPLFLDAGNVINDNNLKYVGSSGTQGSVPNYTSTYYPEGKFANLRTGWSSSDNYMRISNFNVATHGHPDLLSLIAYAYDRPLLVDVGRYSYISGTTSNWLRNTTTAHNTIDVSGTPQTKGATSTTEWSNLNLGADFYEGTHYGNVVGGQTLPHTRSVLFVKPGFWIVSDKVWNSNSTTTTQNFNQNWHYMPGAAPTLDATTKKITTNFPTGANLEIIPADPSDIDTALPAISGYYSENYGKVQAADYSLYKKTSRNKATFDTILYPTAAGTNPNVSVSRLTISPAVAGNDVATALKVNLDATSGDYGYYYLSHESSPSTARSFDNYNYDGKMAYVQTDNSGTYKTASLVSGSTLSYSGTNLVSSPSLINDLSVKWSGTTLELNGSELVSNTNTGSAVAIYAPNATAVNLNGVTTAFTKVGNYIYAVSDAIQFTPIADTFVNASATTTNYNDGATLTQLQVKQSSPYRSGLLKFDLSTIDLQRISSAKVKLYVSDASTTKNENIAIYGNSVESWLQNVVTYSTKPGDTTLIATTPVGGAGTWYEWDVTSYLQAQTADKNVSFSLVMTSATNSDNKIFDSMEGTNKPRLEVTY
jgi:hypothetical protein